MPSVRPGETLAVMDSGAYFTAQESSFGFPRPAVVGVDGVIVPSGPPEGNLRGHDRPRHHYSL